MIIAIAAITFCIGWILGARREARFWRNLLEEEFDGNNKLLKINAALLAELERRNQRVEGDEWKDL